EPALQTIGPGQELEADQLEGTHQPPLLELRGDEGSRRRRAHPEHPLLEMLQQQLGDQVLLDRLPGVARFSGSWPEHFHAGEHPTAVDVDDRFRARGQLRRYARPGVLALGDRSEALPDFALHLGLVEVADHYDRHELRSEERRVGARGGSWTKAEA